MDGGVSNGGAGSSGTMGDGNNMGMSANNNNTNNSISMMGVNGNDVASNKVASSSGATAMAPSSVASSSEHKKKQVTAAENAADLSFGPEFDDIHILSNAQVAVILQVSARSAVNRDEELNDVYRKTQKYVDRFNTMTNPEKEHQELVDELDNLQEYDIIIFLLSFSFQNQPFCLIPSLPLKINFIFVSFYCQCIDNLPERNRGW